MSKPVIRTLFWFASFLFTAVLGLHLGVRIFLFHQPIQGELLAGLIFYALLGIFVSYTFAQMDADVRTLIRARKQPTRRQQ